MKKITGIFVYALVAATAGAVEIKTTALPFGDVGLPYNAVLSAADGTPPYNWSWSEAGIAGYVESTQSNSFAAVGTPQGWQAEYGSWTLPLPFEFPFIDRGYTFVQVSPDGHIVLGDNEAAIVVLGSDLDTSAGDVYVESSSSFVTIRWMGSYWSMGQPVSFSITLSKGGTITMKYGSGNGSGGLIRLSGSGTYLPSTYSYSGSMDNAADIVFKPVLNSSSTIAGLSMSPNGTISGTPPAAFSNGVAVAVSDANGDVGLSFFDLLIYDDRDEDGMLDAWERVIVDDNPSDGIATIYDVFRNGNYDGDTFSNIEEFLLGLDPVVPDGDPLDTIEEGLDLMAFAMTNEADSAYLSMIDGCFETVIAADSSNYTARIYRAASRLVNLVNNEDLRLFLEESGGSLGYDFELAGMLDQTNAPLVNAAIDRICTNVLPALEASYQDLAFIPTNWSGTSELSTNYFPMDETVYVDIGDVTSVMSALKQLQSSLLTVKAQSLNVDYEKLQLPIDGPLASITVDGDTNDWASVPVQLIGELGSGIGFAKAARSASSVYLLIDLNEADDFFGIFAEISLELDAVMTIRLFPDWGVTSVWFEATQTRTAEMIWIATNGIAEIEIPVPPGNTISNVCIQDITVEYGTFNPYYGYLWYGTESVGAPLSTPADVLFRNHPEFLQIVRSVADPEDAQTWIQQTVRSVADLAGARACMQQAFDLCQLADTMIKLRTDTLMHFIEYDPTNEVERAEFFGRLQQGENSLAAPLFVVATNSMGELLGEETVHLGAFYEPDYLTRAMLPEFWQIIGQPLVDTLPDPTFGGILPNMTDGKLMAYLRQDGEEQLDWDGDGLPNGWEYLYGGNPTNLDALADNDSDGCFNLNEYLAGTDPTNAASCFRAEFDALDAFHMVISWQSAEDRVYDIHWSPGLEEGFQLLQAGIAYPQNAYTDTVHAASASGFYRITARMPGPDDLDADGLPDEWEEFYFGSYSAGSGDDTDGDGQDNIHEYIAGTNPDDITDFFAVTDAQFLGSGFMVEWVSVPDRAYSVKWAPELGAAFQTLGQGIAYPASNFTDTLHSTESKGFYKVYVEMN